MFRWILLTLSLLATVPAHSAPTAESVRAQIKGRDAQALMAARTLTRAMPTQYEAWIELARAELHFGEAKRAVDAAEQAVSVAPDRFEPYLTLSEVLSQRINEVGMFAKMGVAGDLREALETARRLAPQEVAPRRALMQYYMQAPGIAGGSMDKARAESDAIAALDIAEGHAVLAMLAQHDGQRDLALSEFRRALSLKPESPRYRLQVGLTLQAMERWEEAFAHFETWVAAEPESGAALYQLGRTAALSGQRLDLGVEAFQRFLALAPDIDDPEPTYAWFRLGEVQRHAGRSELARHAFERAVQLDANNDEARKALAAL